MRSVAYFLLVALLLSAGGYGLHALLPPDAAGPASQPEAVRAVNAVLGNESYRALFGTVPQPDTPERLRLRTHLAYVEALLRSRPRPALSPAQRTRRAKLLDALRDYWTAGRFPRNTEVPGRSPVFIDEQGRLCAVGHLIAVTAGRPLAERIDARYHLADVRTMDVPAIDQWAERHGVTRRELAMIQPTYDCCIVGPEEPGETEPSALETTALSASVGASIVNGVLLERGSPSVVGGAVGVAGGATSLSLGLSEDAAYPTASSVAGLTSVVLGTWSLLAAIRTSKASTHQASALSTPTPPRPWSVAPTSITTVTGTTQPGVRATIRF